MFRRRDAGPPRIVYDGQGAPALVPAQSGAHVFLKVVGGVVVANRKAGLAKGLLNDRASMLTSLSRKVIAGGGKFVVTHFGAVRFCQQ